MPYIVSGEMLNSTHSHWLATWHLCTDRCELWHVPVYLCTGERLSDEEVNELLQGHEDSQGNVNYEGLLLQLLLIVSHW